MLDDVTLVVPGTSRRPHRRLVIEGDRLADISPAQPGSDPDGHLFALPGLVDAHVHFPSLDLGDEVPLYAFLALAHGVTSVRSLGDVRGDASARAQAGIDGARFAGPHVVRCALVDGPDGIWSGSRVVEDEADAERVVTEIADRGFDCVKVYDDLRPNALAAVRAAARRAGLPVVGHVPRRVDFADAGLDDAQHLRGIPPPPADGSLPPPPPTWWRAFEHMSEDHLRQRIDQALDQGTAITPTLAAQSQLLVARDTERFLARPELALLPPWYADALWHPTAGISAIRRVPPGDREWLDPAFAHMRDTVRALYEAGVPIHTGTDSGAPGVVPGAALHEELRLLEEAGLTAEQALEASTVTSAAALGGPDRDQLLTKGAPADLVLFARDPTESLDHLDSIVAVVQGGRLYPREVLDRQLRLYRERYEDFGPRTVLPAAIRAVLQPLLAWAESAREEDATGAREPTAEL